MRLGSLRTTLGRMVRVGIFSLVLLALVLPAASAAGTRLWVKRYNGPASSTDEAAALAFDSSGNIYVAGRSKAAGTAEVYLDYLVIKYGPGGTVMWVKRYNGAANGWDAARAIAVDDDGNVYVTGVSAGSGTFDDYATIKYSASGAELWVRRYSNGAYMDTPADIAIDSFGNVIVTGVSASKAGGNDYYTIKYGPGGTTKWAKRYDGPATGGDKATGVVVDSEDNVYVTGTSEGEGTGWDFCTIKYSSGGTPLWVKRWDGPGHLGDGGTGIAIDESDLVYVTGYSYTAGNQGDYMTIAYTKDGTVRWTKRYDGPAHGEDGPTGIAVDGDGVYVTGGSVGNNTGQDYATVGYRLDGTQRFVKRYTSSGKYNDWPNAIAAGNGRVYVTGFSNADCYTIAYGAAGGYKWSDRYNGPAGAFDQGNAIGVNPANGNVFVTGGSLGIDTKSDFVTIGYTP